MSNATNYDSYTGQSRPRGTLNSYPSSSRYHDERANRNFPRGRYQSYRGGAVSSGRGSTSGAAIITGLLSSLNVNGEKGKPVEITIDDSNMKVTGHELDRPAIRGYGNRLDTPYAPGLQRFLFFNLSKNVQPVLNERFEDFFNNELYGLVASAGRMGLGVADKPINSLGDITDEDLHDLESRRNALERSIKAAKDQHQNELIQMMFVVVSDKVSHAMAKFLSIDYDIPIQCISEDKFALSAEELLRKNPHYFKGLLRDVNAKIGGRSIVLHNGQLPQVFAGWRQVPNTMVIGVDGCQPSADDNLLSPMVAVIGSYDIGFTKYAVSVSVRSQDSGPITNLDEMMVYLLKFFKSKNNCLPANILYFRNCAFNDQVELVKSEELCLIKKAFNDIGSKLVPKITALAIRMDHDIQFNGHFEKATYVDHTITSPDHEEFYLASLVSPKGSVHPAKFTVLSDDHGLSTIDKVTMTYFMCYGYGARPTPKPVPIPVKFAELSLNRAKLYLKFKDVGPVEDNSDERKARQNELIKGLKRKLNNPLND